MRLILIVAALILLILDAIGVPSKVNLQSAALACLTGTLLL
jgi:hypothetical protein